MTTPRSGPPRSEPPRSGPPRFRPPSEHSADDAVRLGHQPETGHRLALGLGFSFVAALFAASLVTAAVVVAVDSSGEPERPLADAVIPRPGVEPNQRYERLRLSGGQRASLGAYGWADREAGVAVIPIGRAMELMTADRLAGAARPDGAVPDGAVPDEGGPAVAPKPDPDGS